MEKKLEDKLLRLGDFQYFADPSDNPDQGDDLNKTDDNNDKTTGVNDSTTGDDPDKNDQDTKTFTQEDIDRIVRERLERERKKREAALEEERKKAERERLKEQEKYKDLYEDLQKDIEEQRKQALEAKKEAMLVKAGYSEDQAKRYVKYLEGETDDDLNASLDALKADIPPKKQYADPNPNNGGKQTPKRKTLEEKGKSVYQRLKEKGKIRGK